MKKIFRIILKYLLFYILKFINFFLYRTNYKIIPTLSEYKKIKFEYSEKTRRLVLRKNKKLFDKIYFDSTHSETDLCLLGRKYNTNKSSLNLNGHRSGYTSFYSLIFDSIKKKNCNIAEIGIEKNGSTRMWRKYFSNAYIHCFEIDEKKINFAKKQRLSKVSYHYIDVANPKIIKTAFSQTKAKFDVIIDDSTHKFDHQINIVKNVHRFLKKNGVLIIEDIYRVRNDYSEKKYFEKLKSIKKIFSKIIFIETNNINNFTANWKCEKLLLFIKK